MWCALAGKKERAFKSMTTLYGNVPEYDREHQWSVLCNTVKHERSLAKEGQWKIVELTRGSNGVRPSLCCNSI